MSDWYSHIDARQITDVVKAQEVISGKKPTTNTKQKKEPEADSNKNNSKNFKIVKSPNLKIA
jgi:Asp-tRNA(Asn)/Glu-tRNA(Gln) amidotransferase A subunit family amidase